MQSITLLCIGTLKESWIATGVSLYQERVQRDVHLHIVELPASKQKDVQKQQQEECERLLQALEKEQGMVVVLDETGKTSTSTQFSRMIADAKDGGDKLVFVLGGAYGLNDALCAKADRVLSLSAMTFPHELCRLIFMEQLYRALQIEKGTGYHH